VNSRLAKLESRLEVSGLVFSDDEQADWQEAWEGFAEHWLPDMPEIDPKWAAAGAMIWACYNLGAPRLEIAMAIKRRAAAGQAAPPGTGPVVDGQSEPATAGGPVAPPAPAYTAEIFRPFGES
jgi:hypothetical protein